jgi:ABC-2 type transport system ATP-binding protein
VSVVIETQNLCKTYESPQRGQSVNALKNLTIQIHSGEIFAYLGPNGSGKTTTIKMLLGLIFPTTGTIRIFGREDITAVDIKRKIGYLPEGAYYPEFLRGEEVLRFYGQLYGLRGVDLNKRIDAVLETVGMTRARRRLIRGYSKGMRQRIGLAQALISDPQILILDEPTTGLDPIARKEIRDILIRLRDAGKTLMISSHELLEVELISNRAGILFEGDLQTIGTIHDLLTDRDASIEVETPAASVLELIAQKHGIRNEDSADGRSILRVPTGTSVYAALDICKDNNIKLVAVAPRRETLEELFVRIVGDASAKKKGAVTV